MNKITGMIFLAALVFSGCTANFDESVSPWDNPAQQGKVLVRIRIQDESSSGRTVLPQISLAEVAKYQLKGKKADGTELNPVSFTNTEDMAVSIEPGTWDLTLTAYRNAGAEVEPYLIGKLPGKTITEGETLSFVLRVPVDARKGTGNIVVTLDGLGISDSGIASAQILGLDAALTTTGVNLDLYGVVPAASGKIVYERRDIKAGDYTVKFLLKDGAGYIVGTTVEVIQVRNGFDSVKNITIGKDDVAQAVNDINGAWTRVGNSSFGTDSINSIAWGSNMWVAGGDKGKIAYSADNGKTWTRVATTPFNTNPIYSIAWGSNMWVAGGTRAIARSADNGKTWTQITANVFSGQIIRSIAWANNVWVAGSSGGIIGYSTDNAQTWTQVNNGVSPFESSTIVDTIAWGNNMWVAGGTRAIARSADNGKTWISVYKDPVLFGYQTIYSIAWGNGIWVAAGGLGISKMWTSPDGRAWEEITSPFSYTDGRTRAIWADNIWVAGDASGMTATSTDGKTWTRGYAIPPFTGSAPAGMKINTIAYGNGVWIAGFDGGEMTYFEQKQE